MATEINPLIIPFDSLLVTRSKREYRETVRGWGEEPFELEGLDGVVQVPLCYLAKSLENMSLCHAAYFVKGWEDARGCRIEHEAAEAYGLEVLHE